MTLTDDAEGVDEDGDAEIGGRQVHDEHVADRPQRLWRHSANCLAPEARGLRGLWGRQGSYISSVVRRRDRTTSLHRKGTEVIHE